MIYHFMHFICGYSNRQFRILFLRLPAAVSRNFQLYLCMPDAWAMLDGASLCIQVMHPFRQAIYHRKNLRPQPRGANPTVVCGQPERTTRPDCQRRCTRKILGRFRNRRCIWRASQPMTRNLRHDGQLYGKTPDT